MKLDVDGFLLEIDDGQCFISKGKFSGSLNCAALTGEIGDFYHSETLKVPEKVLRRAEKFEADTMGWDE